ncbi:MAG: helix-turn-helix transcriptional regulator [Bacteroidetes bacterium]|nr:helix-turn-helix transcriptional regulator [Bacteroidota bacterium]
MTNNKSIDFSTEQQQLASFARVFSHPARIAIIQLLAEKKEIRTGNISDFLPLSRTTVSQHLKELKAMGIIDGSIDGLKIHYCLNMEKLTEIKNSFNKLFESSICSYVCSCD